MGAVMTRKTLNFMGVDMLKIGDKALITTDNWFYAPDGNQYKSVFGTIKGIYNSEETLGIKTNARSTNWYVTIGDMTIAGCQIHYLVKTDSVSEDAPTSEIEYEGKIAVGEYAISRIYLSDL